MGARRGAVAAAMTLLIRILLLMVCMVKRGDGYGYRCPYGPNCFEPAPPGSVPLCAPPGLTYCSHTDTYPSALIARLIKEGRYDIRTLLVDETMDNFEATFLRRPATKYGPPGYDYGPNSLPNVDQISLVDYNYRDAYIEAFSQKTALHPPTAGDPYNPAGLPFYQLSNFTLANQVPGLQSSATNVWGQSSQNLANYDQQRYSKLPAPSQYYRNDLFGGFRDPGRALSRQAGRDFAPYSKEFWRSLPRRRTEVTIERSISLPGSSSALFPFNGTANLQPHVLRRRRRQATNQLQGLSGADALRIALQQSRDELEEEEQREKRQNPNEVSLCRTDTKWEPLQAALNKKGDWRYIVNMPQMTQLVRVERCRSSECNGICSLPLGYTSRCEQKFIQKRLVSLKPDGSMLATDTFWIPSCCQCTIVSQ